MVLRKAGDHNLCAVFEDDEDCVEDGRGRTKRERGVIQTLFLKQGAEQFSIELSFRIWEMRNNF